MKERLMEILTDLRPDVDFETETELVSGHILDSLDIVSIHAEIEDEFDIKITPKDFVAENFNSVEALCKMIERLTGDK